MKRAIWAIVLAVIAIGASVVPPASAAAGNPCYEHECHNKKDCKDIGCLNGCAPLGVCNPSGQN